MSVSDDFHKRRTKPEHKLSSSQQPIEVPQFIGPYRVESLLDRGGMSILYLGSHPETYEPTTIKVLSQKFLSNSDVVDRFLREAEIIALADHPNIVKLYGHGEWEGGLYIAMEFIQGISLRQLLLQKPLSLTRALEIIIDIAYALCHLHTHGVVHRDLKPENVLVTENGEIKVIDFGIAQLLTEQIGPSGEAKQRLIGTPIYMSPEQREDPTMVSYPSDIYSLGIISYELVLGKLCHGQIHLSLMPKGFQLILKKALQPNPDDRYLDIVDFITDVTAYLNSPDIQREKNPGDKLSELSEEMHNAQSLMIKENAPSIPGTEMGLAVNRGLHLAGFFYDFIPQADGDITIIIGEPSAEGAEGLIHAAMVRGMLKTLALTGLSLQEQLLKVNTLCMNELQEKVICLKALTLHPKQKKASFISCGLGSLWKLGAHHGIPDKIEALSPALGVSQDAHLVETQLAWNPQDILLLHVDAPSKEASSDALLLMQLLENQLDNPQRLCDALMRRFRASNPRFSQNHSFVIIAVKSL